MFIDKNEFIRVLRENTRHYHNGGNEEVRIGTGLMNEIKIPINMLDCFIQHCQLILKGTKR